MKKSFTFFALSLISLVLFSCSSFQNSATKTSISLSLPQKTIRAITSEEDGDWTLKINLSGDLNQERIYQIQENSLQEVQTFIFEDLEIGQNLKVTAEIYLDDVRKYKSQQEYSLTLEKEENVLDVVLVRDIVNSNISIKTNVEITASFVVDGETQTYSNLQSEIISIPYSVEKITFTFDASDDASDFVKIVCKLNNEELNVSGNSISIVPKETDNVLISFGSELSEENVNVISFSLTSSTLQENYTEFKFYLIDDSETSASEN